MGPVETISKVSADDPGTGRLLLELGLYEALCAEADLVADDFDRDVRAVVVKGAGRALEGLSQRYEVAKAAGEDTAELEAVAAELGAIVLVAKNTPDDPNTPYFDARDERGRFARFTGRVGRILDAATGVQRNDKRTQQVGQVLNAQGYDRVRQLGGALQSLNSQHAQVAGGVARLIGDIGPEAQEALSNGIRRTAYRYRGTERRPNPSAQRNARLLAKIANGERLSPAEAAVAARWETAVGSQEHADVAGLMTNRAGKGPVRPRREMLEPAEGALVGIDLEHLSPDQVRLRVLSNYGALLLKNRLPDLERANISFQAGRVPPSIGLMFDADGNLVSEAQGFNGDHYLPFDLRNLKRLRGGQYVRTRVSGGLTDEDVYTGLMTGARMVTVISNSGVYSLEFDKDLRGGRRYSDKARQMVDRYAALTGTIGTGNVRRTDISREDKQRLRAEAVERTATAADAEAYYERKLGEARARSAFEAKTDDELEGEAAEAIAGEKLSGQAYAIRLREKTNELREAQAQEKVSTYQLDHAGYKAAQESLAQEFPFFVRSVRDIDLNDFLAMHRAVPPGTPRRPRPGKDRGHIARGGLAPAKLGALAPAKARPERREVAAAAAPAEGPKPEAPKAEGAAAPSAPSPAASLDAELTQAAKERFPAVSQALYGSLRARTFEGDWPVDPDPNLTDEQAARTLHGQQFAKWLMDKGVQPAARYLVEQAPPEVLDKAIEAMDEVERMASHDPAFPPENFAAARAELLELRRLRKPWATSPDDLADPPRIEEIVALGTDKTKIAAYDREHPQAAQLAERWEDEKTSDLQIGQQIAALEQHVNRLAAWTDPDNPPAGIAATHDNAVLARDIQERGEDSSPRQDVANAKRAWALLRLHQLASDLGGGAVPFGKRTTRVVLHAPSSPVAKSFVRARSRASGRR